MAIYKVDEIIATLDRDYKDLSRTYFMVGGQEIYIFHKPENAPKAGQELEGTIAYDKSNHLKFTKAKTGQFANTSQGIEQRLVEATNPPLVAPVPMPAQKPIPAPLPPAQVTKQPEKVFRADLDKMKQDFTLQQATNMSIQRQVAVKGAVDLIVAKARLYSQFYETYTDIMELLSEPNWRNFKLSKEEVPIENYDRIPLEEDVDAMDGAEAFDRAIQRATDEAQGDTGE